MNDKELLELAAKAAGIELFSWSEIANGYKTDTPMEYWNPLTDDGDALRLAVKLRIEISFPGYIKPDRPVVHAGKYWHRNDS